MLAGKATRKRATPKAWNNNTFSPYMLYFSILTQKGLTDIKIFHFESPFNFLWRRFYFRTQPRNVRRLR